MVIDTASATAVWNDTIYIDKIDYVTPTGSAGDECKVTDKAGTTVIFDSFASGSNQGGIDRTSMPTAGIGLFVTGIAVPTLTSGKVYIYYR
jgi:hypothetical protein